jgi:hypothetical protein
MDTLAAIRPEESRLEKQLGELNHRLSGVREATRALGSSTEREVAGVKKHVLSAAGRAAIVKAAKKRWAKVRRQAKKAAGSSAGLFTAWQRRQSDTPSDFVAWRPGTFDSSASGSPDWLTAA